jgi:hypothetical protein
MNAQFIVTTGSPPGRDHNARRKADIASRRCWAGYMKSDVGLLERGVWAISDNVAEKMAMHVQTNDD